MAVLSTMNAEEAAGLKARIERVLSEILSDKHDCNITVKFEPKGRRGFKDEK